MNSLVQSLRYSLRALRNAPAFTVMAILTLALGIGVNTAMFSALDAMLLRPLPYHDPGKLVMLWEKHPQLEGILAERLPTCIENYQGWKSRSKSFQSMGALVTRSFNLTGVETPQKLDAVVATSDLFSTLGVSASVGRTFTAEEEQPGKDRVVLLSHELYQQRFGGDPHVLNQQIALDGNSYTIIGVMPKGFHFPYTYGGFSEIGAQVLVPLNASLSQPKADVQNRDMMVIARLKPRTTLQQARSEMDVIAKQLDEKDPELNRGGGANVFPLHVEDVGEDASLVMLALQAAVGFVLLIACANIANLLLVRATRREKEIAVRMALGAGRGRIIRLMLMEGLLLSVLGGAVGLLLAHWSMRAINHFAPRDLLGNHTLLFDTQVFVFTLLAAVVTGLLFGTAPAVHAVRQDISEVLNKTARSLGGRTGKTRAVLVVVEVSLALVLLVGAGLMVRSLRALRSVDPGFVPDHLLTAHVILPRTKYQAQEKITTFCNQLLERLRALPGAKSASLSSGLPLQNIQVHSFRLPGQSRDEEQTTDVQAVTEDYFQTMGSPLIRGRQFTPAEANAAQSDVTIINLALANRLWPKTDPLGKEILVSSGEHKELKYTVVGVVPDTHQLGLDTPPRLQMYFPSRTFAVISVVLRTTGDPNSQAGNLTRQVLELDNDQPVSDVLPMEKILGDSYLDRRFGMWLTVVFAGLAMVMATAGLYSVLAYVVSQRTHEIGIRMALGAQRLDVVRMVLRQGVKLTVWGLSIGLAAALALTRILSNFVFGVSAADPATLVITVTILLCIALLASYVPARRATKVDPMVALRYE